MYEESANINTTSLVYWSNISFQCDETSLELSFTFSIWPMLYN